MVASGGRAVENPSSDEIYVSMGGTESSNQLAASRPLRSVFRFVTT